MGLSSSQARLLSLTGRMHDIEYKAQHLEAQKLQMANESAHVYKEYENALNATKIQVKQLAADGSASFVDATYNSMKALGYTMKFEDDYKPIISATTEANLNTAGNNRNYFIALETGRVTTTNQVVDGYTEIYTAEQFKNMSTTGKYRLMSDIDFTGISYAPKTFSGELDGNGYSITGLNKSLFTTINNATISNLSIQADITSSNSSVGILANTAHGGNLSNISVSGSINATNTNSNQYVGGLIGFNSGSSLLKINNISSEVNITKSNSNTNEQYIGGIIGKNEDSKVNISDCTYNGTITLEDSTKAAIGGIIGCYQLGNNDNESYIKNCSSSGTINDKSATATSTYGVGGILGVSWTTSQTVTNAEISNSYSSMDITTNGNVGGLAGYLQGSMDNCYYSGTINSTSVTGGIAGIAKGGDISNVYVNGTINTTYAQPGEIIGRVEPHITDVTLSNSSGTTGLNKVGHEISCANDFNVDTSSAPSSVTSINIDSPHITNVVTVTDTTGAGKTFDDIAKYGGYILEGATNDPVGTHGDDSTWFTNMVNGGFLFLFKRDNEGNDYQVNVATDTSLQEVSNSLDLKKAEAKYEADMRKIDAKDKKFDTNLAALEQERNAINTEMDTLKNIAKDNVDRTFKLFS